MNLYLAIFVLGLALIAVGVTLDSPSTWRERSITLSFTFGVGLVIYGMVMSVTAFVK